MKKNTSFAALLCLSYALVGCGTGRQPPHIMVKEKAKEHLPLLQAREDADAAFRELDAALEKAGN